MLRLIENEKQMKFAYLIEPPFNYRDKDNFITGCDVELAKTILGKIDIHEFEPIETEFAELLPGVSKGTWRMTTGLFATEERRKFVAFSRPIWGFAGWIVGKQKQSKKFDRLQINSKAG